MNRLIPFALLVLTFQPQIHAQEQETIDRKATLPPILPEIKGPDQLTADKVSPDGPDNSEAMLMGVIGIYDNLLSQKPNDEKLRLRYIGFLKGAKEWERAATQVRKLLEAKPQDMQYQKLLEELKIELNKLEAK